MDAHDNARGADMRCFLVVVAVADGLTYPKRGQVVTIHYTATTTSPKGDGAMVEFDSTHKRGKPLSFRLGSEQVVPGLEEGVAQVGFPSRLCPRVARSVRVHAI